MRTRGLVLGIILAGVLCGAFVLAGARTAWATPFLDFEILAGAGGSISWGGDALPLIGSKIDVSDVVGKGGTPANNGVKLDISGGLLNFTSGPFLNATADSWVFSPAGSTFTITGAISGNPTTVLLGGNFTTVQVTQTTNGIEVALGGIIDVKNPDLLAFYGYSPISGVLKGSLNLSFLVGPVLDENGDPVQDENGNQVFPSPGDAFASASIGSGNVINLVPVPAPEPAAATLLASSVLPVLAFMAYRRRRA